MSKKRKILVVDDSPMSHEIISDWIINSRKEEFFLADNVSEAITLLDNNSINFIICDYEMPGGNGVEVLKYLKENNLRIPFVLFTGRYDLMMNLEFPLVGLVNDKDYSKLFKLADEYFKSETNKNNETSNIS